MSIHINPFILRMHTAATENLSLNSATSWELKRGSGVLEHVAITEIINPMPEVKTSTVDIPAANGVIDATEADGQVFYSNKPVQITIQVLSAQKDEWFEDLYNAFKEYHGRVVDFSFSTPNDVEWYYTGRLSIDDKNEVVGTIVLKIDTEPFMKSATLFSADIPTMTSLDRSNSGWTVSTAPSGATVLRSSNHIEAYGKPGDVIHLSRSAGSVNYTIAMSQLRGGDFTFTGGRSNKVYGAPSGGTLSAELTIDGSYYAWHEVNGTKVYEPCVVMDYIITTVGSGGTFTLPSNVTIWPKLYNLDASAADVLLDGKRIAIRATDTHGDYAGAVLPGRRADRSGAETTCYITAVGNSTNDSPSCRITYRKEKLG